MILTLFKSIMEAYTTPEQVIDAHWDDIAESLMIFYRRDKKEDAPMFNLWEFNPNGEQGRKYHNVSRLSWDYYPGTIRRCSENALGLWGLVLDCDSKLTMEQAIDEVHGIEYVLYSSFRHSAAQDKFRIVIPFTRMMTKEEFNLKRDDMKACFPLIDTASFSTSQAIFLHSGSDESNAIALRGRGAMIDPDSFISKEPVVKIESNVVYTPPTDEQKEYYKTMVREALLTCSGVNRSGSGEGITLAAICRSAGMCFEEFGSICQIIGRDGSSLKTLDVQGQFWGVVGPNPKVRKETRDKFITDHGGKIKTKSYEKWQHTRTKIANKYKAVDPQKAKDVLQN